MPWTSASASASASATFRGRIHHPLLESRPFLLGCGRGMSYPRARPRCGPALLDTASARSGRASGVGGSGGGGRRFGGGPRRPAPPGLAGMLRCILLGDLLHAPASSEVAGRRHWGAGRRWVRRCRFTVAHLSRRMLCLLYRSAALHPVRKKELGVIAKLGARRRERVLAAGGAAWPPTSPSARVARDGQHHMA